MCVFVQDDDWFAAFITYYSFFSYFSKLESNTFMLFVSSLHRVVCLFLKATAASEQHSSLSIFQKLKSSLFKLSLSYMFRFACLLLVLAALMAMPGGASGLVAGSKELNNVPMYLLTHSNIRSTDLAANVCRRDKDDPRCSFRVNGVGPGGRMDKDAVLDMVETNWALSDEPLNDFSLHVCCLSNMFFLSPPGSLKPNASMSSQ